MPVLPATALQAGPGRPVGLSHSQYRLPHAEEACAVLPATPPKQQTTASVDILWPGSTYSLLSRHHSLSSAGVIEERTFAPAVANEGWHPSLLAVRMPMPYPAGTRRRNPADRRALRPRCAAAKPQTGSGLAALLDLARRLAEVEPVCTVRFVAFANEERPFFMTRQQRKHRPRARRAAAWRRHPADGVARDHGQFQRRGRQPVLYAAVPPFLS
jgi:hypothetical protein